MGKKPFFAVASIILFLGLGLACVPPVDIDSFLSDPRVQEQVEAGNITVTLNNPGDVPHLSAGFERIFGLLPNRYYRVEEFNDLGAPVGGNMFVTSAGGRATNLNQIGRVSGGAITGLDNEFSYSVWETQPLSGTVTYYPAGNTADIIDGAVSISGSGTNLELDFSLSDISSLAGYSSIVKVPISSVGATETVIPSGGRIGLEGPGIVTDYVLFNPTNPTPNGFRVLRVNRVESPQVRITVSYTSGDPAATVTPNTLSTTQAALQTAPLLITLTGGGGGVNLGSTQWWYNGQQVHTGPSSFSMGTAGNYDLPGQHIFTLRWDLGGGQFVTSLLTVTVTP